MTAHVGDELPALLGGELPPATTDAVLTHLRDCADCGAELRDTVRGHAALVRTARLLGADGLSVGAPPPGERDPYRPPPEAGLPPLVISSRPRPRRLLAAAAAAVVLTAGVASATTYALSRPGTAAAPRAVATAELRPVPGGTGPGSADGRITMTVESGTAVDSRQMTVTVRGLPAAGDGHFYEVWLFRPATGKMLPVGVLTAAGKGRATFSVPAGIAAGYTAVDVSRQPDNGNPAHSTDSVLRAQLSS